MSKVILGFVLHDREKSASTVQELLTAYGCSINTRLGLHTAASNTCSPKGLILLEFADDSEKKSAEFEKELKDIAEVDIQIITAVQINGLFHHREFYETAHLNLNISSHRKEHPVYSGRSGWI